MTLKDFFDYLASNPNLVLFWSIAIPLSAFLIGLLSKGEGHLSPWKYLYSFIIYLVCVPGIFVLMFNVYLFLFERQSIWNIDLYTQVLPVLVMAITLIIIKRFVSLDDVPGFEKLGGLLVMITAILMMMWFVDKTRIFVFTYMPFSQVVLIMVALLVIVRFAWKRIAG
jgi:hypothetical protein